MSVEAQAWAISQSTGNATRKLVLWGLANGADKHGVGAWPSVETLAEYAECDPRTVRRHLSTLLEMGMVREGDQRMVQHLDPRRRPIVYDLAMAAQVVEQWKSAAAADTRRSHAAQLGSVGGAAGAAVRWGCPDILSGQDSEPCPDSPRHLALTTGTLCPDKAVSGKPSVEPSLEPGCLIGSAGDAAGGGGEWTVDRYVRHCHAVFNRAQELNPATSQVRPIFASGQASSWDAAAGWFRDAIPLRIVEAEIARITGEFEPAPTNPRISGLKYFDTPVRKGWETERARAEAASVELPKPPATSPGERSSGRHRPTVRAAPSVRPRGRFRDADEA